MNHFYGMKNIQKFFTNKKNIDLNLSNNAKSIKLLVKYVNYHITLYKYFSKGLLLKLKKSVE